MRRRDVLICGMIISCATILYAVFYWLKVSSIVRNPNLSKVERTYNSLQKGDTVPSIDILLPDSLSYVNVRSASRGKSIILFYFGPDCPYCQAETREIISNINLLKNIQFYFLTPYSFPEMKRYYRDFNLEEHPDIFVGFDYKYDFVKYFNTQSVPFMAIFNSKRVLTDTFLGNLSIVELSKMTQE